METESNLEVILSAKGNPLFRVGNYLYEVDKEVEDKFYCRCIRKKSEGCEARVSICKIFPIPLTAYYEE